MNYTKLTINGSEVGLKFGMHSLRYLRDKMNPACYDGDSLTEIGIAHVIYGGYVNNCAIKDIQPELTFEGVVDFVESCLHDADKIAALSDVIKVWAEAQLKPVAEEETKKKKVGRPSKG